MTELFGDASAAWAAIVIVVLPIIIIAAGEIDERLRQRDSPLHRPMTLLRVWVIPIVALWVLLRALFDFADDSAVTIVTGTLLVLAVGATALAVLAVANNWLGRTRTDGRRPVPRLLLALPRFAVILIGAWLIVAGVWNVDLSAALTALGVTSLVISFALQDTLSGLASGFLLLTDQPFHAGDWVSTGDFEGEVLDINWRSTRIRTRNGDLMVVPNGFLANANIINFDEPTRLHRVVVPVQVAFVNAPTAARGMLLDAARSTPGVLAEPPPAVRVVQVDDPLMGYEVDLWIDDYAIAPRVSSEFGALVWYHSHRHGVPLPSPAQDLFLHDADNADDGTIERPELRRRLRASALLDQVDEDDIDALAAGTTVARYAAGEALPTSTAEGAMHMLHAGRATVVLGGRFADGSERPAITVLQLEPGDLFGMVGDIGDHPQHPTLVALDDCELLSISHAAAADVISRHPRLSTALEQTATTRRRRIERATRRNADTSTAPTGSPDGA